MVEVRFLVIGVKRIPERFSVRNGTLGDVGDSVHEGSADLSHAVEVDARADAFRLVLHINDHHVAFADMQRRTGHLEIYAQNPTLDAISRYTFPVEAGC